MEFLWLSNNGLKSVQPTLFANMPSLTELYLNGNEIEVLDDPRTFTANLNLTHLVCVKNWISKLHPDLFRPLTSIQVLDLSYNRLQALDHTIFASLSLLENLALSNNELRDIPVALFANLPSLKYLMLGNNYISQLHPDTFSSLPTLYHLDLSKNGLTMVDAPTFLPIANTINSLSLQENRIAEVGAVLDELRKHHSLAALTMQGNPSECVLTSKTNANINGGVVCRCQEGFERMEMVGADARNSSRSIASRYLCQQPSDVVIVAQAVMTLRSSKFALVGPSEQLAEVVGADQDLGVSGFKFSWNGWIVDSSHVSVAMHWLSNKEASIEWRCIDGDICGDGARADIVNPPKDAWLPGLDAPQNGAGVRIFYKVNATAATDTSLVHERRSTLVQLAYSAFNLPGRFGAAMERDQGSDYAVPLVAGSRLSSPSTWRILEHIAADDRAVAAATDTTRTNRTTSYGGSSAFRFLPTTANVAVEANPYISTSITFQLANNTCNESDSAPVLDVRPVYSTLDRGKVVGWEVVVGDPIVMARAHISNMRPCRAILQARDSISTETLDITAIEASRTPLSNR